jgi:hypothetical protein
VRAAHRTGCGGRLVEPVRGASEGSRDLSADRARPGVPAGSRGSPQILVPVVDQLVEEFGGGEQGRSFALSTFLNCSKIIERGFPCQAAQRRVRSDR